MLSRTFQKPSSSGNNASSTSNFNSAPPPYYENFTPSQSNLTPVAPTIPVAPGNYNRACY